MASAIRLATSSYEYDRRERSPARSLRNGRGNLDAGPMDVDPFCKRRSLQTLSVTGKISGTMQTSRVLALILIAAPLWSSPQIESVDAVLSKVSANVKEFRESLPDFVCS